MRKLSLVLAATLMAGALSACGSNGNTNDNSPAASGNGDTGKAKDVELKVFVSLPRFKNQFEQYFEQFKKKELAEKNINVKISLEMPSADTADQILKSRMSGGDSPTSSPCTR